MGWSCSVEAARSLALLQETCVVETGVQNEFRFKGQRYFFELSKREHEDGSITGSVWKFDGERYAKRVSSFKIGGDGSLIRGTGLKAFLVETMKSKYVHLSLALERDNVDVSLSTMANRTIRLNKIEVEAERLGLPLEEWQREVDALEDDDPL